MSLLLLLLAPFIATAQRQMNTDPSPNEFIMLEREPAPINLVSVKANMDMSKDANVDEMEGRVIVRVLVSKFGSYVKHVVLKSANAQMTLKVIQQLPNLIFTPGIQSGKPIACWTTLPFFFKAGKPQSAGFTSASGHLFFSLDSALAAPLPTNVIELHLQQKALTQFPLEVLQFPQLTHLNLSGNQLTTLPDSLVKLQNLEVLDLRDNRLRTIPAFLLKSPSIKFIIVTGNDLLFMEQRKLESLYLDKLYPKNAKGEVIW